MNFRQAEVLAHGSVMFLDKQEEGPTREAVLMAVVSAAGQAVLRLPKLKQVCEQALGRCATALCCAMTGESAAGVESPREKLAAKPPTQRRKTGDKKGRRRQPSGKGRSRRVAINKCFHGGRYL